MQKTFCKNDVVDVVTRLMDDLRCMSSKAEKEEGKSAALRPL